MSPSNTEPTAPLPTKSLPSANWKALLSTMNNKPKQNNNNKRSLKEATKTCPSEKKRKTNPNTKAKLTSSEPKEEKPSSDSSKVDPKDIWFDDISPADWELAYGKSEGISTSEEKSNTDVTTIVEPKSLNSKLGKYVAMDCEMVGVGPDATESALARVSIVNFHGAVILDKFVKPQEPVTDYRTFVSGITPDLLKTAEDFKTVQAQVAEILKDRIVVGHGIHNDFLALLLNHPRTEIRDTQTYHHFKTLSGKKKPALRKLAALVLKKTIQQGSHSSVEDARHTMLLYQKVRNEWEGEIKAKQQGRKTKTSSTTTTTNVNLESQISVSKSSTKTTSVAATQRTKRRK